MKLCELKRSTGLKSKSNRVGRGNSSKGTYSGRGQKGQKARSGHSAKPFFEGGQTSIVMRMPKARGFKRNDKLVTHYSIVNLNNLEKDERVTKDMEITKFKLKELGYIKKESEFVKILGNGDFSKKLTFTGLEKFSKSALEKIEKAGAKVN